MDTNQIAHQEQRIVLDKLLRTYARKTNGGDNHNNSRFSDKVFDYVVEGIRTGRYPPGVRITERSVARQLDISHVPVREAMEKLLQHGWVERQPQKGIYVKSFNETEIREIYQLREAIETAAIRIIADKLTDKQLIELKNICNLLESSYYHNNADVFKEADTQFHRLLVRFAGNQRLQDIFDSVVLQARCFFFIGATGTALYKQMTTEYLDPVSHVAIYEALSNKDWQTAEELVRKHIMVGHKMITELRGLLALK